MDFATLGAALISAVHRRVGSGLATERGLARRCGLSQPHVHHVLSGKRRLTLPVADRLLAALGMSVLDLAPAAAYPRSLGAKGVASDREVEHATHDAGPAEETGGEPGHPDREG
ncbi:MAG: helix-turn-helix transcriptional regulator [Acidobacteria bacterium]|nr:helix-turn-helix transcriptional regulator [Acidobacteriota bacterium]MBI3471817.1 helix-turn-helix transcriptional regulator [Candidatus Solibacter usitatus]